MSLSIYTNRQKNCPNCDSDAIHTEQLLVESDGKIGRTNTYLTNRWSCDHCAHGWDSGSIEPAYVFGGSEKYDYFFVPEGHDELFDMRTSATPVIAFVSPDGSCDVQELGERMEDVA